MRVSAYLEMGIGKESCDERLLLKSYQTLSEDTIAEGSMLMLQTGEFDGEFECPLMIALADGREEFLGAGLASELCVHGMSQFDMAEFMDCTLGQRGEKAKEEEKPMGLSALNDMQFNSAPGGSHGRVSNSLLKSANQGVLQDSLTSGTFGNIGNMGSLKEEEKDEVSTEEQEAFRAEKFAYMKDYIHNVNEKMLETGKLSWAEEEMASFLTGLVLAGDNTYLFHLGNLKLLRKKGLSDYWEQMTEEHIDNSKKRKKEKITGCLGSGEDRTEPLVLKDVSSLIDNDKRAVLMSEGVHRHIGQKRLKELFAMNESPLKICRIIANEARDLGSREDISIVLLNFPDKEGV